MLQRHVCLRKVGDGLGVVGSHGTVGLEFLGHFAPALRRGECSRQIAPELGRLRIRRDRRGGYQAMPMSGWHQYADDQATPSR